MGGVAVALNSLLRPAEYEYMLNDSRGRVVIVSESLLPQLQAIPKSNLRYVETVIVHGKAPETTYSLHELLSAASPELEAEPTSRDDAAFWLYSSGSTGRPKGCVHLHHDMVVCAERYAKDVLKITENDPSFTVAKLFFPYDLSTPFYFPLSVGATNILWPGSPSPPHSYSLIEP